MIHGGDIYRNEVKLDFSVNVNPLGIPAGVAQAMSQAVGLCSHYPDIRAEVLKCSIEGMTGVGREAIVCGNGASELFLAIAHALKPRKTAIPVPSFFGYEYAATAAGSEIVPTVMSTKDQFCLTEDLFRNLNDDVDLMILANPNNPVGNLIPRASLERLIEVCLKKNIVVVVDECFIEFTGKEEMHSLKHAISEYPNLIVVRAFTKIFAIPGVRLGYLFCQSSTLRNAIERQLPEWNLSVFAQAAGVAACDEHDYLARTVTWLQQERAYLAGQFSRAGIRVFPSEANFVLIQTELPLYEELLKRKILIRDCSNFRGLEKGFFRIAVKRHEENEELLQAIGELMGY